MSFTIKQILMGGCSTCLLAAVCSAQYAANPTLVAQTQPSSLFAPPPVSKAVANPYGALANASRPAPASRASFQNIAIPRLNLELKPKRKALKTLSSTDDLGKLIRSAPGLVLLDFYADWCGPCKTQGKILHDLEETAARNGASIIKIDVDQHKAIASVLKVSDLPTLMLVKDGKIIGRKSGLADAKEVGVMLAQ